MTTEQTPAENDEKKTSEVIETTTPEAKPSGNIKPDPKKADEEDTPQSKGPVVS